jgi:Fic family protein
MAKYNWEQADWPYFTYSLEGLESAVVSFAEKTGHATGILKALPEEIQMEAIIELMVVEAIKTSEIEGEFLSRKDVLSSIRRNLGLVTDTEYLKDKKAEGVGKLMTDVRQTFSEKLTEETLFGWHRMLFPGDKNLRIGAWRDHEEPMQVISGAMGKLTVHFEAPPSIRVPVEMERFINWFNETTVGGSKEIKNAPLRSAIAHLFFETIHPFEDGNGRIGRAIAEKALSQGIGKPVMLSLSRTIEANKNEYYDSLQAAQRSNEITPWVNYFVKTVLSAQTEAEEQIDFTLKKVKFYDRFKNTLSERHLKVVARMLEEGIKGFKGGMNANKYASLTKVSKATATRDLQELIGVNAFKLIGDGRGRSTSYEVNL